MATTVVPLGTKPDAGGNSPGRNDDGSWHDDFGGSHHQAHGPVVPARVSRTGMWMALAAIVMLFAAFTSSLVVRRGMSNDWRPMALPPVLWLNTLVLLASSLTLERSRKLLSTGCDGRSFAQWWHATTMLGFAFLAGQWFAWHELAKRGIYLASNPSSSFFYLLTAAHGVHLLGGMCVLCYVSFRTRRYLVSQTVADVTAIYWHFMDGLWIYLLLLMFAERWF